MVLSPWWWRLPFKSDGRVPLVTPGNQGDNRVEAFRTHLDEMGNEGYLCGIPNSLRLKLSTLSPPGSQSPSTSSRAANFS